LQESLTTIEDMSLLRANDDDFDEEVGDILNDDEIDTILDQDTADEDEDEDE
jgi:hypothetical protein